MDYQSLYRSSIDNPQEFWADAAASLDWNRPWDKVLDDSDAPFYQW
jgi:propionyl-CoA synthetase